VFGTATRPNDLSIALTKKGLCGGRDLDRWQVQVLGEMQGWRDCFKSASRTDVSAALVSTAFAAKNLKATKLDSQSFPESFLHGRQVAESPEARRRLVLYADQVNLLRAGVEHSAHPLSRLAVPGLEVLVLSILAVSQTRRLFSEGQMLWRELVRGIAEYPITYRILLNSYSSADEIADDLFVPAALVGEKR